MEKVFIGGYALKKMDSGLSFIIIIFTYNE